MVKSSFLTVWLCRGYSQKESNKQNLYKSGNIKNQGQNKENRDVGLTEDDN